MSGNTDKANVSAGSNPAASSSAPPRGPLDLGAGGFGKDRPASAGKPVGTGPGLAVPQMRGRRDHSPESEIGDVGPGVGASGIHRSYDAGKMLAGRPPRGPDARKFQYDVYAGKANMLKFAVTRDDRMPAAEAGSVLHRIHELMHIQAEDAELLYAFDRGLFFCHTVNGGSTLNPGRSKWSVPGYSNEFDYAVVCNLLGVDLRRFFRAFADDIAAANKSVLDAYDPNDVVSVEHHGWLMEVAAERGLTRYPHLAHDSADACTELNMGERQALINSKKMVISSVVNTADRMRNTSRVMSADSFDSTAGNSVE